MVDNDLQREGSRNYGRGGYFINWSGYRMKYFPWVVSLILAAALFVTWSRRDSNVLEADFMTIAPEPIRIIDTVETIREVERFKILPPQEKVEAFQQAITKREYKETFKTQETEINVRAKTTGTLDSLQVSFKESKKTHLYLGSDFGPKTIQVKAIIERPKTLYSVGYDIHNKAITAGVAFKIF